MRYLVTGAAGFIGHHLCRRLSAEGHAVVALDDMSEGKAERLADLTAVEVVDGDLCDPETLSSAARGSTVIFHQGAKRAVERSLFDPSLVTKVNLLGTINVLTTAREVGARVVFASSSSVYGDQQRFPLDESMDLRPRSPYAASKAAAEAYCRSWWFSFGVPAIALRYFNVYGPGMDPHGQYALAVPLFVHACLTGSRPVIHGDGEQSRDFTYIDDVVEANLLAARAPEEAPGRAFNIGGGVKPTSINQLLAITAELTGVSPDPLPAPPRAGDVRTTHADISLAGRLLGYEPKTSLREGLAKTVEWFRAVDRPEAADRAG
jgi:nucleoside-diphosphate-sugar epimerase